MWLQNAANVAVLVGSFVALLTLIFGVFEYFRQGRQRRAEHFFILRERLKKEPEFRRIVNLLRGDEAELADIDFATKAEFVGLLEEVALMMNSGLVSKHVAHYMFGYYTLICDDSANFWKGMEKEGDYWALFRQFASRMRRLEVDFDVGKVRLRL